MKSNVVMNFVVDKENSKVLVEREFAAPVANVWSAFTESQILDQWWAPKPWQAKTKSQDFQEGGTWLYSMVGPDGTEHWSLFNYESINPQKSFGGQDAFCDENGVVNPDFPTSNWSNTFSESTNGTTVSIEINYPKTADLEKFLEMGFKEGFTLGLDQLDDLLAA
ncbi:SRPBCC family protein [Larkinella rosea]|uniref:SRPBCC domain-containing protein n=1 Tax=Larkinella rosea TaxID=2025312 RepID=A0A3P1BC80_9BACT|nr:SRPBCC domain-containing protein [Larkinella rosea]RRA98766.1 SRPBCC domain-containing protein [Larkinella rosea]